MTREEAQKKILLAFEWVPVEQLKETIVAILANLEEAAVERSITRAVEQETKCLYCSDPEPCRKHPYVL